MVFKVKKYRFFFIFLCVYESFQHSAVVRAGGGGGGGAGGGGAAAGVGSC